MRNPINDRVVFRERFPALFTGDQQIAKERALVIRQFDGSVAHVHTTAMTTTSTMPAIGMR